MSNTAQNCTIPVVGHFEKVSLSQFQNAIKEEFHDTWSDAEIQAMYDKIELPVRATSGSAGYDFRTPFIFDLEPNETIKIPTGIRAVIQPGWFLGCIPRSGLGFKYELRLFNTFGCVDNDYAQAKNEGHIFVKFRNGEKYLWVDAGDRIFQGILIPHGITDDDNASAQRNNGFGSTGR